MVNIFKEGPVVSGESLIGRRELIRQLREWGYMAEGINSYSLVGVSRIGKTSLINNTFSKKEAAEKRFLLLKKDLSEAGGFVSFWKECFEDIIAGVKEYFPREFEVFKGEVLKINKMDKLKEIESKEGYSRIRELRNSILRNLAESNIRLLLIIDEFDAAVTVFENKSEYFSFFRSFTQNSDFELNVIILSRRTIEYIETEGKGTSTFAGVFRNERITGFDDSDLAEYYSVLNEKYSLSFDGGTKTEIENYCGRSPYLLSMFGSYFAENNSVDAAAARTAKLSSMRTYFKKVTDLMREERILEKLISIVIGPQIAVDNNDISIFESNGMIYKNEYGNDYICISPEFSEYLKSFVLNIPTWHLIHDLEKTLRLIIGDLMPSVLNCAPEDWPDCFYAKLSAESALRGALEINIKLAEISIKNSEKDYGQKITFLEAVSMKCLFNILMYYWKDGFADYFGALNADSGEQSLWKEKFMLCAKARNPYSHNTEYLLKSSEKRMVDTYIKEILNLPKIKALTQSKIIKEQKAL